MERMIGWESGVFDEMSLVYEKAEKDENIGNILAELEKMALQEAVDHCDLLLRKGQDITKEMFPEMTASEKEQMIYHLSGFGLESFNPSFTEPVITVVFSAQIQMFLGCTMFQLLNSLEKLDGAYNAMLFPKATLKLLVPLGGKKGLFKCEMLIMALYPWLSVTEESSNMIAADR